MQKDFESSPGEELIAEILKEKGIKFEKEKKISNLKDDYADYRIADFYLPRYKVYIEFLGKWNEEEARIKYNRKRKIYEKNRIPCIYIYPDNLGIFDFIFTRRLKEELKKYPELKFQKLKYNFDILMDRYIPQLILIGALIYYIANIKIRVVLSLVFASIFYNAMKSTFLKNKINLQKLSSHFHPP